MLTGSLVRAIPRPRAARAAARTAELPACSEPDSPRNSWSGWPSPPSPVVCRSIRRRACGSLRRRRAADRPRTCSLRWCSRPGGRRWRPSWSRARHRAGPPPPRLPPLRKAGGPDLPRHPDRRSGPRQPLGGRRPGRSRSSLPACCRPCRRPGAAACMTCARSAGGTAAGPRAAGRPGSARRRTGGDARRSSGCPGFRAAPVPRWTWRPDRPGARIAPLPGLTSPASAPQAARWRPALPRRNRCTGRVPRSRRPPARPPRRGPGAGGCGPRRGAGV